MADVEFTEQEKILAGTLIETLVVLGCSLIKGAGEEAAKKAFAELAESKAQKLKNAGKLGEGFQEFADGVTASTRPLGEELLWDIENKRLRITKCGLWEAGKKLGYEDTPLCSRCKTNSDVFLKYMVPGYKKTIFKTLWWGDDECDMVYTKED